MKQRAWWSVALVWVGAVGCGVVGCGGGGAQGDFDLSGEPTGDEDVAVSDALGGAEVTIAVDSVGVEKDGLPGDTSAVEMPLAVACQDYCAYAVALCGPAVPYATPLDCEVFCEAAQLAPGAVAQQTLDDTIGCRIQQAATDCGAAGPFGGGICGDPCESYCHAAVSICPSLFSPDACAAACQLLMVDDASPTALGCRRGQLYLAALETGGARLSLCHEATPTGGEVCGVLEVPATCAGYCEATILACPGAYQDKVHCLRWCQDWAAIPPGEPGDQDVGTLECRLAQIEAGNCDGAGPTGGGYCGAGCPLYCQARAAGCDGGSGCAEACAEMDDAGLECRLARLVAAAASAAPNVLCGEAAPGSCQCRADASCGPYCELMLANCPAVFDTGKSCEGFCAKLPTTGDACVTEGHSLECRALQASLASANPAAHCDAAGPTGGGVCGEPCAVACQLESAACGVSVTDCAAGCGALTDSEVACKAKAAAAGDCGIGTCMTCADYCTAVESSCGLFADGSCAGTCGLFPHGPTDGFSFECHLQAALSGDCATADPANGQCGSPCEALCALLDGQGCGVPSDCLDTCAATDAGVPGATTGDSVACRLAAAWAGDCESAALSAGGACAAPPPTCADYCAAMAGTCQTSLDPAACAALCPLIPSDDLGCHLDAALAGSCGDAAPASVACASPCEVYCAAATEGCGLWSDDPEPTLQCLFFCGQIKAIGAPTDMVGDSLHCRLNAAWAGDCASAGFEPAGSCVDSPQVESPTCDAWCSTYTEACASEFSDESACLSYCEALGWPLGTASDDAGATLGCHLHYAGEALGTPPACAAASPAGGGVCGDYCEAYCQALGALCATSAEACMTACAGIPSEGLPGAQSGDSVACRVTALAALDCVNGGLQSPICVPADPVGESCETPIELALADLPWAGSTSQMGDHNSLPAGSCGAEASVGQGAPDRIFRFVAPSAGTWDVSLSAPDFAGAGAVFWLATDCEALAGSCVAIGGPGTLQAVLKAGEALLVGVDGASPLAAGPFELDIATCLADCTGKVCGTDGCLGQCGACAVGEACSKLGQCLPGDGCGSAIAVSLDTPVTVLTESLTDQLSSAALCPSAPPVGQGSVDVVFSFSPPFDGLFRLDAQDADGGALPLIWGDGCDPPGGVCGAQLEAPLSAGTVYTMVVFVGGSASATLAVTDITPPASCQTWCAKIHTLCLGQNTQFATAEGCLEWCSAAQIPDGNHLDTTGNTLSCRYNHLASIAAADVASQAKYCAAAGPTGGGVCGSWCDVWCDLLPVGCPDQALAAVDCLAGCAAIPDTAPAISTSGDSVQCRLWQAGQAAQGVPGACEGAKLDGGVLCYTPPAEAETCEEAAPILILPFEAQGSTVLAEDDYAMSCLGGALAPGNGDKVFRLVAPETASYRITVTGEAGFDAAFAVSTACPSPGPCRVYDNPGVSNPDVGEVVLAAGDSVWVTVDSRQVGSEGAFTLSVVVAAATPTCALLCDAVAQGCAGEFGPYADQTSCLTWCKSVGEWAAGAFFESEGNTIGCRLSQAQAAMAGADPSASCAAAGPTGGGICGTWCQNYCDLSLSACPSLFESSDACFAACGSFPADAPPEVLAGDSVQCRLNEAGLAKSPNTVQPAYHCAAASPKSNGVCGGGPPPSCADYCALMGTACADADRQYVSEAACLSFCAKLPLGTLSDTTSHSVGCRQALAQAISEGALPAAGACPAAGPSGAGTCGAWCEGFCDLAADRCPGLYGAGCADTCAAFSEDGAMGDPTGDTVQCRLTGVLADNCAAAAPDGGGVCVKPPPPGDTCGDALEIASTPFQASGDTLDATDHYHFAEGPVCKGSSGAAGGLGAGEIVYRYTAAGGPVTLRGHLENDYNALLYAVSDCADVTASCLGSSDALQTQAEVVEVSLKAGETVYWVIDGSAGGAGAGAYTLTVTAAAPSCEAWCQTAALGCPESLGPPAACVAWCADFAGLPIGPSGALTGNTVACRQTHAVIALEGGGGVCDAAGPSGGGVCGSACELYCYLADRNCPDLGGAGCPQGCAQIPPGGTPGILSGDSVQCRISHLGRAGDPLQLAPDECAAAALDGGGVCGLPVGQGCKLPRALAIGEEVTGSFAADETSDVVTTCGGVDGADRVYQVEVSDAARLRVTLLGVGAAAFGGECGGASCQTGAAAIEMPAQSTLTVVVESAQAGDFSLRVDIAQATCAEYCAAVLAACPQPYSDQASCLGACAAGFEFGPFVPSGNTTGCRTVAAEAGQCAAAGPSGGGVCGDRCDAYCALDMALCGHFSDLAACHAACALFPGGAPEDAVTGNSLPCRINALVAGQCAAADVDGGGVCASPPTCKAYCAAMAAACPGEFSSDAACLGYCQTVAAWDAGAGADVSHNTVGCRLHFAGLALTEPTVTTHCQAAGRGGGGVCGSLCENLCQVAANTCPGQWPDSGCAAACLANAKPDGQAQDLQTDTVSCRLNNAALAVATTGSGPGVHCPAAGPSGGGICDSAPVLAADSCGTAETVTLPEFLALVDTSLLKNRYAVGPAGVCSGPAGAIGAQAPDAVYRVLAAVDGPISVTASAVGFDPALYVLTDCAASSASCLQAADAAGGDETLTFDAIAGETYFVVLDGSVDGAGEAILSITGAGVPTCAGYCDQMAISCPDQYLAGSCVDYCETFAALPAGVDGQTAGNTVGCRTAYAALASQNPQDASNACLAASASGGDMCGSYCEVYCTLVAKNCPDTYGSPEACAAACPPMAINGVVEASDGDTLQCRLWWAGVAGDPTADATAACLNASATGGARCVAPVPTCAAYCDAISSACVGADAQYLDSAECLAICQTWAGYPVGTGADLSGDTLGCRLNLATAAAFDPAECAAAGPGGGGVCGGACASYCRIDAAGCQGFATESACNATCAAWPNLGAPLVATGDSVDCRLRHAILGANPANVDPQHCQAAAADGGGICVDPQPACADYCAAVTANCTGAAAQYADQATCLAVCATQAAWPLGALGAVDGNTVGCRQTYAEAAASTASGCVAAGPTGDAVCGSACDNWCQLVMQNCAPGYADLPACLSACAAIPAGGSPGDSGGDSLQCRLTHALAAGASVADVASACAAAAADGGTVCVDPKPTCAQYCAALDTGCPGTFDSAGVCESWCVAAAIPVGAYGDDSGDTIGCRLSWAELAAGDAGICAAIGPQGAGICGGHCEVYCRLGAEACGGADFGPSCAQDCAAIGQDGQLGDETGDTIQCRLQQLSRAVLGGSDPWCARAGLQSPVCSAPPTCDEYCGVVTTACTGTLAQYDSTQACLDYCGVAAALSSGTHVDTAVDTVGCRIGAANQASATGGQSCLGAGPSGGGVCGTWCDVYCARMAKNCPSTYPEPAACQAACGAMAATGAQGDTVGDTVQCRIHWAGRAGSLGAALDACAKAAAPSPACVDLGPGDTDLSGWTLSQTNPAGGFVFPAGTPAKKGQYAIVGNDATRQAFESYWFITLDSNVLYFNSHGTFPNLQPGATVTLSAADSAVVDGPTLAVLASQGIQRIDPAGGPNAASSWGVGSADPLDFWATPGFGQSPADAGVFVSEVAASPQPPMAYVELYFDSPTSGAQPTWTQDAKPVFNTYCAGCHANADAAAVVGCPGGPCFVTNYAATKLPAQIYCQGLSVGECTRVTIQTGLMPPGCVGECVSPGDQAILQSWIDAGLLE